MNIDLTTLPKLNVGSVAPNFSLSNQKGEIVQLSEILKGGKIVLLVFYPGDMTPGCTTQLCGIRDIYTEYENAGVKVLGINQGDEKSHQKFIKMHNYQFDILVDPDRKTALEYGAIKKMFGHNSTKRGVFLIDTNGKIIYQIWGQQDNRSILDFIANSK